MLITNSVHWALKFNMKSKPKKVQTNAYLTRTHSNIYILEVTIKYEVTWLTLLTLFLFAVSSPTNLTVFFFLTVSSPTKLTVFFLPISSTYQFNWRSSSSSSFEIFACFVQTTSKFCSVVLVVCVLLLFLSTENGKHGKHVFPSLTVAFLGCCGSCSPTPEARYGFTQVLSVIRTAVKGRQVPVKTVKCLLKWRKRLSTSYIIMRV